MAVSSWIPTVISGVATSVSLLAFAYQVHRARFNQSVDLLFRLENDFFGGEKVTQRALAAKNYLADAGDFTEMEDVLDFFETVAMLTRKKALNLFMVWHTFDYWMERYYAVAAPHIERKQSESPGVWEDLQWILPRLQRLEARKGRTRLDEAELLRFMKEESEEC